jgi:hypothetical protein
MVGVGVIGLVASGVATRLGNPVDLRVWLPAAAVAIAVAASANARKARRMGVPLWSGAFRKTVWVMAPVLVSGAVLTFALWRQGATTLVPGTWLALYGAGVTAGGTLSVRAVRGLGIVLSGLGAVALLRPRRAPGRGLCHAPGLDPPAPAPGGPVAEDLDRLIHERIRLGIVSALAANETMPFADLRDILGTTDGNLSVHARKLEDAGYVRVTKGF